MKLVHAVSLLLLATALLGAPFERELREREIPLESWLPALTESARQDSVGFEGEIAPMALPSEASHFIAIAPCRVVDTRRPDGLHGGPILTGAVPRAFNIPSGPCAGIPAASAYSFNIAVTGSAPGAAQFLTAWPAGTSQPVIATMNFNGGQTVSNAALVPADGTGTVAIYASATTHVILDINGYIAEGVVTSLAAGTGLTGGGSGAVSLGIAAGGVGSAELAAGAVETGAIADGAVTGAKIGNGQVVRSVNGLTDLLEMSGTGGATVSASGSTIEIDAPPPIEVVLGGTVFGSTYDLDTLTPFVLCERSVTPAYDARAIVHSWGTATSSAGAWDLRMSLVTSTDGGVNWSATNPLTDPHMSIAEANDWATASNFGFYTLNAGSEVRFGIRMWRGTSSGTTADLTAVRCRILIQVFR